MKLDLIFVIMSIQLNNIGRQAFFYRKESTQEVWPPEIPQPEDTQNIEEQNIFTEVPKQPSIKETQSADVSHSMPGIFVQCFWGFFPLSFQQQALLLRHCDCLVAARGTL